MFNLLLKISKLQEELTLYRNGTSGQELLDLLAEKDAEVERVRGILAEKHESLKKLAKKGAEVLARCDSLQTECGALRTQSLSLTEDNRHLTAEVAELKHVHASAAALCTEKDCTIEFLEAELAVRNDSVDKLHARCAELVAEKSRLSKELARDRKEYADDRAAKIKQSKELMEELERSMRFNTEVKERLNREHANGLQLTTRVSSLEAENKSLFDAKNAFAILLDNAKSDAEEVRQAKAAVEADLSDAKLHLSVASSRMSRTERQEGDTKHALAEKNNEITRLRQRLTDCEAAMKAQMEQSQAEFRQLERQLRIQTEQSQTELRHMEGQMKREAARMETETEEALSRIRRMEDEAREQQEALKRDRDREYREAKQHLLHANSKELVVLQAKNQELEDKIRRQEHYMKSRLLKDRSNLQTAQSVAAVAHKMKENNLAPIPPSLQQYCHLPLPPAISTAMSCAMTSSSVPSTTSTVGTSSSPLSRAHPPHPHHSSVSGGGGTLTATSSGMWSGAGVGGGRVGTPEALSADPSYVYRPPSARAKALAAGGGGAGTVSAAGTMAAIASAMR